MYKSRARFSPRALLVKGAAWILVEGKGNASRVFEPMTSEQQFDAFPTWISVGELHGSEGCYMFCDDNKTKTYEATGQSSSIAGNKTKKSSDESPTDQKCSVDLKPGDCELVVDGGRALQPCRYRWCTHMSCIIIYPYSTYPCRGYFHTQ